MDYIQKGFLTITALCLVFVFNTYAASENKEDQYVLRHSDSLFDKGFFTSALQGYEYLYKHSRVASDAMLLRMAYIYEGTEENTMALYMLHKYYLRHPDHEVLRRMADIASKQGVQGYTFKEESYLLTLYKRYERELLQTGAILSTLLFIAAVVGKWRRGTISPGLVMFLLLVVGLTLVVVNRGVEKEYGIVMQEGTWVYKAPASGSKAFVRLPRGTRVVLEGISDKWYKATLEDSREGYVNMFNVQHVY